MVVCDSSELVDIINMCSIETAMTSSPHIKFPNIVFLQDVFDFEAVSLWGCSSSVCVLLALKNLLY